MAATLNSTILDSHKNFIHSSDSNLMMSAILNSAILDSATFILDSDKNSETLTPLWLWLKVIQSN